MVKLTGLLEKSQNPLEPALMNIRSDCNNIKKKIEVSIIEKTDLSQKIKHINACPDCNVYYESEKSLAKMISERFKSVPIIVSEVIVSFIILFTCISCYQMQVKTLPRSNKASVTTLSNKEVQRFDVSDEINIIASSGCNLVINEMERQVIMKQPGDLYVKVEENKGKPLKIITPTGNIITRGTEFCVRVGCVQEIDSILVYVINGSVELTTPRGDVVGDSIIYRVLYADEGSAPVRNYSVVGISVR